MLKRSATGGLLLRVGLCEILKVYISNGFSVCGVVSRCVYSLLFYNIQVDLTQSHTLTSASRQ